MSAGQHDFTLEQGATFAATLVWGTTIVTPIDLTGYTARMQIRRTHKSTETLLSLTSPAGGITITPLTGTIAIVATAAQTATLPAKPCVYDIEVVSGAGVVTRILEGHATVTPEVTR